MPAPASKFWPSRELFFEWLRFVAVGGINTAFGYAVYALCVWLGAGYQAAITVTIVGGVLFHYRTTGAVVVARRDGSFARFIGCYALVLALSVVLLKFLDTRGINAYLSGLIVAVPAALLSFLLLRTYVFRVSGRT